MDSRWDPLWSTSACKLPLDLFLNEKNPFDGGSHAQDPRLTAAELQPSDLVPTTSFPARELIGGLMLVDPIDDGIPWQDRRRRQQASS
jgi:hypothetical protein